MDEGTPKSCWGVTVKAIAGFAGILLLTWLVVGVDAASVVASAG